MQCPLCHLENPPTALRCDCDYDFKNENDEIRVIADTVYRKVQRRKVVVWAIAIGIPIALAIARVALQVLSAALKRK
jgi:hypothetical protein